MLKIKWKEEIIFFNILFRVCKNVFIYKKSGNYIFGCFMVKKLLLKKLF